MSLKVKGTVRVAFALFFFVSLFLLLDGSLQLMYRLKNGEFTWETIGKVEIFQVAYLTAVEDERYVVPNRAYTDDEVRFDEFGFRVGSHVASRTQKNIIFLGDSVPFGYHASAADTVPSRVSELLKAAGVPQPVLNAAVPSYSLDQAVYRYVYDVKDKFPASIIILQTYDPAGNFYWLGKDWDVTKNWHTSSAHLRIGEVKRKANKGFSYSSLYFLFWKYSGLFFQPLVESVPYTQQDIDRYRAAIVQSLDTLVQHADAGSRILLLPVARPPGVYATLSPEEKVPVEVLYDTLASYASASGTVDFLDTNTFFAGYQDREIFQDVCCHLTSKGLELEAGFLADYILSVMGK